MLQKVQEVIQNTTTGATANGGGVAYSSNGSANGFTATTVANGSAVSQESVTTSTTSTRSSGRSETAVSYAHVGGSPDASALAR